MKKLLAICLSMVLALSIVACDETANSDKDSNKSGEKNKVSAGKEKDDLLNGVTIHKTVIYDENDIKVTAETLEYVEHAGPSIIFTVENNRSENVEISLKNDSTAVNNIMCDIFGRSGDYDDYIPATSSEQYSFGFLQNDLSEANITILKHIEFTLVFEIFSDTDDDSLYYTSNPIQLTTTADSSYVQTYNDSGTVIYEDENFRIVYLGLKKAKYDYTDILFFCENKSDHEWYIDTQDSTYLINGYDTIGYGISFWILPHHIAHDHESIKPEVFTNYGFDKLETMELVFEFSMVGNDIYDYTSSPITITFD